MKTIASGFWIISIALVLTFSMPCYAQIEAERFLPPEGTAWKLYDENPKHNQHVVFLSGYIWFCSWDTCNRFDDSQYKNLLITKFNGSQCFIYDPVPDPICHTVTGYIIPLLRFGIIKHCTESIVEDACFSNLLIRDDNFTFIP
jgi:hypothetical protein